MTAPTPLDRISLDDKYTARTGQVFLSGTQALVRLPMVQMWRDQAAGLNTGTYISGYRGSPLGMFDQQLEKAAPFLDPLDIHFQPGVNEELAATAIWGSQQLYQSPGAKKDGLLGIWYGKGPGVDRCGDVFKHANAAGTSPYGGVLAIGGDDHSCKSSTIPHQSDHAFAAALIPMVYPSSVHEFVELGLFAIAMSRFSGCWSAMKVISDTVETSAAIDLSGETRQFVIPEDVEIPEGGFHNRWPDPPMVQDERLQDYKGYAAREFARVNQIDIHAFQPARARFGIVASGKAFEDVRQALTELDLGPDELEALGVSVYKVRMPWPLEPAGLRKFADGLDEILVVEERREVIEHQAKQQLYNLNTRPRIVGKFDEARKPLFSHSAPLTSLRVAQVIVERLLQLDVQEGLRQLLEERAALLDTQARAANAEPAPVVRTPYFCSGCPHNTSTKVPEGSRAAAGIGCHFMVTWMDRSTEGFTQMGGEGALWNAQAPFTDEAHQFVNIGDGTYFHSGYLAVRAAVSSGANITYKVLYNDAVAMTGGQTHDGNLSPDRITRQLHSEGVSPIWLVSDAPEAWQNDLAPGTIVKHRDHLDAVMLEAREEPGCSAIVFVQTCAAEKRRRRKRGLMEDPPKRLYINSAVCEGCGDCSVQSNCVSIEPLETEFGRKRQINQSSCNKDYSCAKGFCPSFLTVHGGRLKKPKGLGGPPMAGIPTPKMADVTDGPVNIGVTGIGGTGVLTIGALIGMAAHIDGLASMVLDMSGLAQKGGAVISHVRIGAEQDAVGSPRIAAGRAHVLIAADDVVAASAEGIGLCNIEGTFGIVNTAVTPVADFVRDRDFDFRAHAVERSLREATNEASSFVNFTELAKVVAGDTIATNVMMLGYALQKGVLPISVAAVSRAIELNGVAIDANQNALNWGRLFASRPDEVERLLKGHSVDEVDESLDAVIKRWKVRLTDYQGKSLANRFEKRVRSVEAADKKLALIFAENYGRLLAYKDEYEVARLLTHSSIETELRDRFEDIESVSYNLSPPILSGNAPNGRPKKREFGPWITPILRILSRGKILRGTPFDPFGYFAERKSERALIKDYEAVTGRVLPRVTHDTRATIESILSLPSDIRGFGPVKADAISTFREKQLALLSQLDAPPSRMAAE